MMNSTPHGARLPLARTFGAALAARQDDVAVANGDRVATVLANCAVVVLNDQHAIVRVPKDNEITVGDRVGFGVSHPCTTFDRFPLLMIGTDGSVVEGISTFFSFDWSSQ